MSKPDSSPDTPQSDAPQSDASAGENSGRTRSGRFAKGNKGGPGRPRRLLCDSAMALDQLGLAAARDLIQVAIEQGRAGNLKAIDMLLHRIWPVRQDRPLRIKLPTLQAAADLVPAQAAVSDAVLEGSVTPREGAALSSILQTHCRVLEMVDLEQRVTALEEEDEAARRDGRP